VLWAVGWRPRWTAAALGVGGLWAGLLLAHVFTWLIIGVVMAQTFILLGLALACIALYGWAFGHPTSLRALLKALEAMIWPHRNHQIGLLK